MRIRAALVGCGRIGSSYDDHRKTGAPPLSHAGAYSAHPAFELVGIADVQESQLVQCRRRWQVPFASADFRELFARTRPEVVSIATPPEMRLPVVEAAISHGVRAIWCEKPLATSVAEGEAIVSLCMRAGVVLAVNYLRRWEPGCRAAQKLLRSGELGKIQRLSGTYVRGLDNNGGHLIDLIHWWHGPITAVERVCERSPASPDVTLICSDGTPVDLFSLAPDAYDVFELDVFAQHGRIRLTDFGYAIGVQRTKVDAGIPHLKYLGDTQSLPTDLDGTLLEALSDISKCLQGGGTPACSGADGLAVLKVLAEVGLEKDSLQH
jgi:predicted dehydrogenase